MLQALFRRYVLFLFFFLSNRTGDSVKVGTAGNGLLIVACSAGAGQTDDCVIYKMMTAGNNGKTGVNMQAVREVVRGRRRVHKGGGEEMLSYCQRDSKQQRNQ